MSRAYASPAASRRQRRCAMSNCSSMMPRSPRSTISAQAVRRASTIRRQGGAKPGHRDHRPGHRRDHHHRIDDNAMKRAPIGALFIASGLHQQWPAFTPPRWPGIRPALTPRIHHQQDPRWSRRLRHRLPRRLRQHVRLRALACFEQGQLRRIGDGRLDTALRRQHHRDGDAGRRGFRPSPAVSGST